MRKQSHLKKAVSLAVAAAMAVAVCTTALAEDVNGTQNEGTQTEETTEQSDADTQLTTENKAVVFGEQSSDIAVQTVTPNEDGQYVVSNSDQIADVLKNSSETDFTFVLGEGTYTLYGKGVDDLTAGKNITFIGKGRNETTWNIGPVPVTNSEANNRDYSFKSANVTFKSMKLVAGVADYLGFAHVNTTVVDDCEVTGMTCYWGYESALFENSTFTSPDGGYVMWVYSSHDATFDNCIFNASGKALYLYNEGNSGHYDVTVKDCKVSSTAENKQFLNLNDKQTRDGSPSNRSYTVTITNTTVEGLAADNLTETNLFGFGGKVDSNNAGNSTVTVDGVKVFEGGKKIADIPTTPSEPTEINPGTAVEPAAPDVDDSALNAVTDTTLKDTLTKTASSASLSTEGEAGKALTENETVTKMLDDAKATYTTDKELKEAIEASSDSANATELTNADAADIKLVATPYLAVKPLADSTKQQLSFDIKLYTVLKATTNPADMKVENTCTLGAPVEVKDAPATVITLDVGSAFSGDDLYTLYVKHVTESGDVHFYGTKTDANNPGVITFENKHGFSTFTVLSSKESAVVQIGDQTLTYDLAAVGTEFPYTAVEGFDFAGYYFDGIEGCYTTLTEDLFHQLAAAGKGKAVASQPRYTPKAGTVTPAPSEEPKPSEAPTPAPTAAPAAAPAATAAPTPTATPDDSQYYTCTACGHHDWTATADGYKCNTCGHLETKQISGYKNVKGVYTPTASSAKAAAAKATTIPQTSDEMPIVPIAIVAIAALMGLGVTVYMKKKQN